MPLETGSGVRLAVFQETVHHAAFPGVYKGEYRRGLLVGNSHESSNTSERELALLFEDSCEKIYLDSVLRVTA
jgi:hypothetical protein